MRVFLSATSLDRAYGGPALSVLRLGEALQDRGVDVGLWSSDQSRPDSPTKLQILRGSLEEALDEFGDPDMVHDNGLWLLHNHRLALMADRFKWPRYVSTRGMLDPWAVRHKRAKKWIAWRLYQRRDLNRATGLHATSLLEAVGVRRFKLYPPVDVIPNGIDPVDFVEIEKAWTIRTKPDRTPQRRALFIGRLHPVKNLGALLEAWSRAVPTSWTLVLAGPDEDGHRGVLENQIARLGLGNRVILPGSVGAVQKRELLFSADFFVLPSFQESFGIAVAEALAHGLPCITTTGTPWETLSEDDAGWRVAPTVEAIGQALQEATSLSDEERQRMGFAASALIDANYNWSIIASRFIISYTNILSRHGSGDDTTTTSVNFDENSV